MNAFLSSYIATALWSSTGDNGHPLDRDYCAQDLAPETLERMTADCRAFELAQQDLIAQAELSDERAGHCLWLNRNGHGSGFWDEYSQTTCAACEAEQAVAVLTRSFVKRDALNATCNCRYHTCQRLSEAAHALGSCDLYVGDDGQLYLS